MGEREGEREVGKGHRGNKYNQQAKSVSGKGSSILKTQSPLKGCGTTRYIRSSILYTTNIIAFKRVWHITEVKYIPQSIMVFGDTTHHKYDLLTLNFSLPSSVVTRSDRAMDPDINLRLVILVKLTLTAPKDKKKEKVK